MTHNEAFEASKENGKHRWLAQLVGSWKGTAKTWFEPGVLGDESPSEGRIELIMDGRFLQFDYSGAMDGKPLSGKAMIGYYVNDEECQMAWMDSFHMNTSILFSKGTFDNDRFTALGHFHHGEQKWGWRTEIELLENGQLKIAAYIITPEGEEALATEAIYDRQ